MCDEEMRDVESESDGEDGCAEFRGTIQPYMFEPKMDISLSVCLSVCLSVAKMQKRDFIKINKLCG